MGRIVNPRAKIVVALLLIAVRAALLLHTSPAANERLPMPDQRRHRGPHPGDCTRFAAERLGPLRRAAGDYALLLGRGYAERAALTLVGDHFALDQRQRLLLMRAVCAPAVAAARRARCVPLPALRGSPLWIDGFNVLTTVEAALSGGLVIDCRDGTFRDLASMHGTWRRVDETEPAALLVGALLEAAGVAGVRWLLDRPVSNAGRLAVQLRELAQQRALPWEVELVADPDRELARAEDPVATADGPLLDRCRSWVNLARAVVEEKVPEAWIVAVDRVG
jgi:hypothetical protein